MGFGDGDWVCFVRGVGVGVLGFNFNRPVRDLHYDHQVYYQSYHLQYNYPTTILPNSLPTTQLHTNYLNVLPSTSTSSQAVPSITHSKTLPSPRIRKPRFSTRMGSLSPSSFNSNSNIIHHNNNNTIIPPSPPITPISRSTPIPIPPTPNEFKLTPIPPDEKELPLCPELVDQLLRGPVLQTIPLPEM